MRNKMLNPRIYRVICVLIFAIIIIGIFIIRLCYLQIYQYERWSERSKSNHISKRVLDVKRGVITDRNGMELAISVETYHVYLYTKEVKDLNETAGTLSTILPLTREALLISMIDNLDSKMLVLDKAYEDVERGEFTQKIYSLDGRSFYKPLK